MAVSIFPKSINTIRVIAAVVGLGGASSVVGGMWYYFTPKYWSVGYQPTQPGGGFNHQIHAGKLGLDCRYCHTKIEQSDEANIPNVATCYGCHADGRLAKLVDPSPTNTHKGKTQFIRDAFAVDASIEWRRVHKVPDYVRNFPHAAHLKVGVSCVSCHGRIDTMPVVYQHEPLSMSWCLDCHKSGKENLVDPSRVTDLAYAEETLRERQKVRSETGSSQGTLGDTKIPAFHVQGPTNCGACHY